jgi:hypothetical protein
VRQQGQLPDATDLTEAVFAEDPDRRADSREFRLRQVRPAVRVVEREVDGDRSAGTGDEQRSTADFSDLVADDAGSADSGISSTLRPVIDAFDDAGWPYDVAADGSRVSLAAELDGRRWELSVEPAESGERCTATSVHPDRLSDDERDEFAADLLTYNASVDGGGFELGEAGEVRFRTSFLPETPISDVLGDHATAMAEWYDRIAE